MIRTGSPNADLTLLSEKAHNFPHTSSAQGVDIDGIIVLDKPKGITSQKAVEKVKKLLNIKRAGHTGTLDPFATGVLPICLNRATKIIPFLDEGFKEYEAILRLGVETDTMDNTGNVISEKDTGEVNKDDVLRAFSGFAGEIEQIPPMFSAIKKGGVRLYDLARRGKEVERKPRTVMIEKLELLELNLPFVRFHVRCSRGTYVRVLASNIGRELGCGGHLAGLRRIKSGMFNIKDSITLEGVERGHIKLNSLTDALSHIKKVLVAGKAASQIRDGKQIRKSDLQSTGTAQFEVGEKIRVYHNSELICIAEAVVGSRDLNKLDSKGIAFKLIRVFN
ncbi:MAG TPA: tRNA pseudouridine(55) synthase TruB [Thermodesulfobacteriota bacterium]|nr:tRNA pseudouridine(55) synthase TruB [Thermodesulfobacteriota bacterium]